MMQPQHKLLKNSLKITTMQKNWENEQKKTPFHCSQGAVVSVTAQSPIKPVLQKTLICQISLARLLLTPNVLTVITHSSAHPLLFPVLFRE